MVIYFCVAFLCRKFSRDGPLIWEGGIFWDVIFFLPKGYAFVGSIFCKNYFKVKNST